jgi:hypothetical protein
VKRKIRLVTVIPAAFRDDVVDTVESLRHYIRGAQAMVIIDDTRGQKPELHRLRRASSDIHVLSAPVARPGARGGLWAKVSYGFQYALDTFAFDALLRLDADALVIGPGAEDAAIAHLSRRLSVGAVGAHVLGATGGRRDWSPAARALRREAGILGLTDPARRGLLRGAVSRAAVHGYRPGEHPLGCAVFYAPRAVQAMSERGWLRSPELARSNMIDDHIFGLLTAASGFAMEDLGTPGDPLSVTWKGLARPPEELAASRARIVHSVRSFQQRTEPEIRSFFAARRAADLGVGAG